MKKIKAKVTLLLLVLFSTISLGDYLKTWDDILIKYTKYSEKESVPLVLVDYKSLKNSQIFTKLLEEINIVELDTLNENERKAFWINLYNIGAIKIVLDNYPIEGIKKAGSLFIPVWDKPVIYVQNKSYSLGEIEHDILRRTEDELIHFAIVCASISCPDLRRESYRGKNLTFQLRDQKEKFLKNNKKGMLKLLEESTQGDTIFISKIFKWYKDDFGKIEEYLNISKDQNIKYLKYNWNLNSLD